MATKSKPKTASSTPRLSEYARKFVYPSGITKTVWPRVEAKGRELGLGFDWWQSQLGTVCLGYGKDGKYVATVGGVGLSIPRQVGKTYFVLVLLVIMCILFPGLQVVWTAHHLRTSTKTFTHLRGICRRKKIAPHIRALRSANGEQQAEFVNGSMIMFGSRARGFGRGFDEVDVEVFDEAQILDTRSLEDMIAATNQARHEHGALLFFMGTPPRPADPSDAFTTRRKEAWAGTARDSIWLEIGAEPASAPDDRKQYAAMNPSYPKRTPLESMLRLRKNLGDEDAWNREGRGIWDGDEVRSVMPVWALCAVDTEPETPAAIALAVDVDRVWISMGAASGGEVPHLGPRYRRRLDVDREFILAEAARIQRETSCAVVIDRKGPAGVLEDELRAAGVNVTAAGLDDYVAACAGLFDAVAAKEVTHGAYQELDAAVAAATKRKVGDRWAWARRSGDISMLEAVTLAHWAAKPSAYESREMVIL